MPQKLNKSSDPGIQKSLSLNPNHNLVSTPLIKLEICPGVGDVGTIKEEQNEVEPSEDAIESNTDKS